MIVTINLRNRSSLSFKKRTVLNKETEFCEKDNSSYWNGNKNLKIIQKKSENLLGLLKINDLPPDTSFYLSFFLETENNILNEEEDIASIKVRITCIDEKPVLQFSFVSCQENKTVPFHTWKHLVYQNNISIWNTREKILIIKYIFKKEVLFYDITELYSIEKENIVNSFQLTNIIPFLLNRRDLISISMMFIFEIRKKEEEDPKKSKFEEVKNTKTSSLFEMIKRKDFEWIDEWVVDMSKRNSDEQGWLYSHSQNGKWTENNKKSIYKKRRWMRLFCITKPRSFDLFDSKEKKNEKTIINLKEEKNLYTTLFLISVDRKRLSYLKTLNLEILSDDSVLSILNLFRTLDGKYEAFSLISKYKKINEDIKLSLFPISYLIKKNL